MSTTLVWKPCCRFKMTSSVIKCVCSAVKHTWKGIFSFLFAKKKDLTQEIILITGGGRGLGRKLALSLARQKPKHIVVCGRNVEALQRTQSEIQALGVDVTYCQCDVSSRERIYEMAEEVISRVGNVTMLINNAGIVCGKSVLDLRPEELEYSLQVNTLAQIWTIKAFLPSMIENNYGHIVSINSMLGLIGLKGTCDYSISKFAATGLLDSVSQELEQYSGIHVTVIHPYQIDNEMFAGMKVRFPSLFPPLKEEDVVEKTVNAILLNRRQLLMPSYFYPLLFFKSFLPTACILHAQSFLGLDRVMEKFRKNEQRATCDS